MSTSSNALDDCTHWLTNFILYFWFVLVRFGMFDSYDFFGGIGDRFLQFLLTLEWTGYSLGCRTQPLRRPGCQWYWLFLSESASIGVSLS